jgi:sugar lactone lactonase YvrE
MRNWKFTIGALMLAGFAQAQQKGAPQPAPLPCGVHGDAEVICGTLAPEDFEITPDGKFMVVTQFASGPAAGAGQGAASGLFLFDPAKKSFTKITATSEPIKTWGDPACPGAIGAALSPHGSSLVKRSDGKMQLFIVNHGGRESIEMFELKQTGGTWGLVWHGCVTTQQAFNDVAAFTDGGFVATQPTAIPQAGGQGKGGANIFGGQVTGYLVRWTPGKGEAELPGTRTAYPNGVVATPDGKTAYYAVYGAKEARRYDLQAQKESGIVKLDFMPDNLTWTKKGNLLAAGIKGLNGECPEGSGQNCRQAFSVAAIDAKAMTAKTAYDSNGKGVLIPGVSVAIQMGNDLYIGAFQGDRVVKTTWKE